MPSGSTGLKSLLHGEQVPKAKSFLTYTISEYFLRFLDALPVEVRLKPHARVPSESVIVLVEDLINTQYRFLDCETDLDPHSWAHRAALVDLVDKIRIAEGREYALLLITLIEHSTLKRHSCLPSYSFRSNVHWSRPMRSEYSRLPGRQH